MRATTASNHTSDAFPDDISVLHHSVVALPVESPFLRDRSKWQSLSHKAVIEHLSPKLHRKVPCPEVNFKKSKTTKYEY